MKPRLLESPPAALRAQPIPLERASSWSSILSRLEDYLELAKLRVNLLVLLTTAVGFIMGTESLSPGEQLDLWLLFHTLLGTALVAGSAAAINQVLETEQDRKMLRTRDRPLPSGRIHSRSALLFAASIIVLGLLELSIQVNLLAAEVAFITFGSYVFLYTPLKRKTDLATLVGAVPGALPPLLGWAAATGELTGPAWILFGILFFWQLPHFLAIAWLYRDDYARGGFPVLPVLDPSGRSTARQVFTNSLALLPASLLPALVRQCGDVYFWSALGLGILFLGMALWLASSRSRLSARSMVIASIVYLPLLFLAMLLDRGPA
jgi:protoheme IX farnesyltransferase